MPRVNKEMLQQLRENSFIRHLELEGEIESNDKSFLNEFVQALKRLTQLESLFIDNLDKDSTAVIAAAGSEFKAIKTLSLKKMNAIERAKVILREIRTFSILELDSLSFEIVDYITKQFIFFTSLTEVSIKNIDSHSVIHLFNEIKKMPKISALSLEGVSDEIMEIIADNIASNESFNAIRLSDISSNAVRILFLEINQCKHIKILQLSSITKEVGTLIDVYLPSTSIEQVIYTDQDLYLKNRFQFFNEHRRTLNKIYYPTSTFLQATKKQPVIPKKPDVMDFEPYILPHQEENFDDVIKGFMTNP